MWMIIAVPVTCLNHRPTGFHAPQKRGRTTPPASVVRNFEQVRMEHHVSIEERDLTFLLDVTCEEETERLVIDSEDEGIVIDNRRGAPFRADQE